MTSLVRASIGGFTLEDAVDPRKLNRDNWLRFLRPPLWAVECLPRIQLSADQAKCIRNGLTVEWGLEGERSNLEGQEIAALDPAGDLVGILRLGDDRRLYVVRNMPANS